MTLAMRAEAPESACTAAMDSSGLHHHQAAASNSRPRDSMDEYLQSLQSLRSTFGGVRLQENEDGDSFAHQLDIDDEALLNEAAALQEPTEQCGAELPYNVSASQFSLEDELDDLSEIASESQSQHHGIAGSGSGMYRPADTLGSGPVSAGQTLHALLESSPFLDTDLPVTPHLGQLQTSGRVHLTPSRSHTSLSSSSVQGMSPMHDLRAGCGRAHSFTGGSSVSSVSVRSSKLLSLTGGVSSGIDAGVQSAQARTDRELAEGRTSSVIVQAEHCPVVMQRPHWQLADYSMQSVLYVGTLSTVHKVRRQRERRARHRP